MNAEPDSRSMRSAPIEYLLPEGVEAERMLDAVRRRLPCESGPASEVVRHFYDSFDWRLYRAGAVLELTETAGDRELAWIDLATGTEDVRQGLVGEPAFADSLHPGPVRTLLEPVLWIRRLLPIAQLRSHRHGLRVLDDEDKTVVRVVVEEHAELEGKDAHALRGQLPGRIRLLPLRGYWSEFNALASLLEQEVGLVRTRAPLYLELLALRGLRPGGYSSKLDYHLDPKQRADAAAKTILLGLLDTLEANLDGARRNLDSEFLHDLRVATRRTRSALAQIKDVLPADIVAQFKEGFAWLQQVTGPVRDLDVYLLDFPVLRESLPPVLREDLEPLKTFLLSHYDEEQQKLAAALDSPRCRTLLLEWRAFLEQPVPAEPPAPNAGKSIKAVADGRIRRMFKRVRREGRAIGEHSPPEELHELRKSCKKLRYLMEFFQSLYPEDEIRGPIKQIKVLLDNLGRYQDLAVQAAHLQDTAARMHREGAADARGLLAMGALISGMLNEQRHARDAFADTFAGFDAPTNRARFHSLFAAGAGSEAA